MALIVCEDITEGKKAAEQLRDEQRRFVDLVNSIEGIVWEADAETLVFSFVSNQAERILGYPLEQWLREPTFWKDHLHSEDRDWAVEFCQKATARKRGHDLEYRMIAADGKVIWFRGLVTVVLQHGQPTRLRGVMVDATKRKRNEEALREQANLLSLTHDAILVRDMDGAIKYWNRGAEELYGWPAEEALGQVIRDLLKTSFPVPVTDIEGEVVRAGRWEGELVQSKKDGSQVVVASRWSLQRDERGAPVAILVINNDITQRKRAEEAAHRSEKELRDLIDAIPAMAFSARPDGTNGWVNRGWVEYSGLSVEESSGSRWQATLHPDDLNGHMTKWQRSLASGEPFENEARHRSAKGDYRWFLVRAVPLRDEQRKILTWYGTLTDIEDRKRSEALLASDRRILEMVAKGETLRRILEALCRLAEEHAPDVLASVLLIEDGRLKHGAASLPRAYVETIDGVAIGPAVGSCGTAAYFAKQVIVSDIANDPLWVDYRDAALLHSLRACWSTPIMSPEAKVIGTFAMYYREPRSPGQRDQEVM
jgi:PAS domain S-box-containing protein